MHPQRQAQQVRRTIRLRKLRDNPRCLYCWKYLKTATATLDHIIPLGQDGEDAEHNLALCCERCNACKANRSLSQWIADLAQALNSTIPSVRRIS